ncbi:MAG: RNA-binding transcriptional accessory protein [Clostridia bacterium]|nr:RNA-binding transcriptional accessory protein [Clostridia bacterium]
MDYISVLAERFSLRPFQVENAVRLLDDGNTIPFIARYRKEATGSLDDQTLRELAERLEYMRSLEKRKQEVREAIEAQGKLTDELAAAIDKAATLTEVEDIYRPFRPKRRTRASVAKEKGLGPLALEILRQSRDTGWPIDMAAQFVDPEKGVDSPEDALNGAKDIIAEVISDNANIRKRLRDFYTANAIVTASKAKDEDSVYRQYYDYSESLSRMAGHRVLAIDRGEREGFLKVSVSVEPAAALQIVYNMSVIEGSKSTECVREAAEDAYFRLISPSIEREVRGMSTEAASEAAIKVFSTNLHHLLMQPPIKGKVVLALDPAYRTGCKVAVVDETGVVLDTGVVYPTPPHNRIEEAEKTLTAMIKKYRVEVFSIGNGTASKETEIFTANLIKKLDTGLSYMVVSEAGASVYSASKLAAQEFPQYDVSLRSAVSIARRLQDPLAELVKIDPKAIGVGQYQHDMPKKQLDEALGGVVEDCVNTVGVDLNTASPMLLTRVAGINSAVANNIVTYRDKNGRFSSRDELKKVPKLGPKAFEQCAGFLRVPESENVLDNTGVHPESYNAAKQLVQLCGYTLRDVKNHKLFSLRQRVEEYGMEEVAKSLDIGVPTLNDIINELLQPGRDPRDQLPKPVLRTDIMDINDLRPGMELTGTVRNVADFGAFVDIGVHQDGLVHISEIANRFIRHPSEVLKVGDIVKVRVLSVEPEKKRISLSMKPVS